MKTDGFLEKLFPVGQRKLVVSLVALAIGIALEKFSKTGLTSNMQESLIAIVAIFTGGNVMEHLTDALKVFKGTKVGQLIEDVIPGDQHLGAEQEKQEDEFLGMTPDGVYDSFVKYANDNDQRLQRIESALATHTDNTKRIVQMIDRLNQGAGNVNGAKQA